jgi:hypothetical protein
MKIVGVILLIASIVLFFVQKHFKHKIFSLKSARKTTTKELHQTSLAIASEIEGGNWRDYVKLWGTITADEPLISELKKESCVYYEMTVQREYEETVREKNSEGQWVQSTKRRSETVTQQKRSIPFFLKDQEGMVKVDLEGANITTVKILDEFRPGQPQGQMLSFGKFSFVLSGNFNQNRTLGYRYTESILPLGQSILVVGTASDETGELTITKPLKSAQKFIVSLKTDEATTAEAEKNAQITFYSMIGCFIIGIISVIFG